MITETYPITNLRREESVLLFPSFGSLTRDGRTWRIDIRGVVMQTGRVRIHQKLLLRLLQRVLKVRPEELESAIFQQRIRPFTAATEPGKRVAIRVGSRLYRMRKKTKRNGHFRGTLRLGLQQVRRLERDGHVRGGWLHFEVITANGDDRVFPGRAFLIRRAGVSVISDIDDTIKYTDVTSRRALLANTFLHQFKSIDGMAQLYQAWARRGAFFHYVSSSPWQLYGPLSALFEQEGFPDGSYHLRHFRLRDHMLRRILLIRRRGKGAVIKSIVQAFPQRRFVLVGDSGERDPELYGAITRKFPRQIAAIYVRQLAERPLAAERCRKAFREIPPSRWTLFEDVRELPDRLPCGSALD